MIVHLSAAHINIVLWEVLCFWRQAGMFSGPCLMSPSGYYKTPPHWRRRRQNIRSSTFPLFSLSNVLLAPRFPARAPAHNSRRLKNRSARSRPSPAASDFKRDPERGVFFIFFKTHARWQNLRGKTTLVVILSRLGHYHVSPPYNIK